MSIARMMEGQVKQSEADMQILGAFKNEQYLSLLFPSPPPPTKFV